MHIERGLRRARRRRGYLPVVPREAVGVRNPDAHEANLYDIDAKYGDVVPVDEVLEYLEMVNQASGART